MSDFVSKIKSVYFDKKNERINKTNNILETVNTVNSILKILK